MNVPMTDYYPLIDTAVAELENNTGEARRTVYEHARSILVRQSRDKNPPLTKAEIVFERLALEQAILRVEAEHYSSREPSGGNIRHVRPDELTTERDSPSHLVPAVAEASSHQPQEPLPRREPASVRREGEVLCRRATVGVGAAEIADQPPPAPPSSLAFRFFNWRKPAVAKHPGTPARLDVGADKPGPLRGDRSRLSGFVFRMLRPRTLAVAPPTETQAAMPGLAAPHGDHPRRALARL